jgi:hypothetical protein
MVDAANAEVRRVHDIERARLDGEIRELGSQRDALHADVAALESWEREYRGRVISQLEADLATARAKRSIAPPTPPTPPVLAQPAPAAGIAMAEPVEAEAAKAAPPAPTQPRAPEASQAPKPEIDLTRERAAQAAPEAPRNDAPQAVPVAAGIAVAKPLAGSAAKPQPAPTPQPVQPTPVAPAAQGQTGQDARLDDDAFFATLRDAVRDDSPLGPSDERLFEPDREAESRGIFKRKR